MQSNGMTKCKDRVYGAENALSFEQIDCWRLRLQTSTKGSASGLRQGDAVPLDSRLFWEKLFLQFKALVMN